MLSRTLQRCKEGHKAFMAFTGRRTLMVNSLGHVDPVPTMDPTKLRATTICAVRKDGKVCVVGDGQVTQGSQVVKPNATKVRRIGQGKVICGFAGATADALALMERLEGKLEKYPGQLMRSCVELAKEWRTEKYMRHLEAIMVVVDKDVSLTVTGNGDVLEPSDGVIAIGSGGAFALAAARALMDSDFNAEQIAERSMKVAAEMCVYTNDSFVKDMLE